MSHLLTLATSSLDSLIASGEDALSVDQIPAFTGGKLELRGLTVSTSLLAGMSLSELDSLRDHADKAGCPCLTLIESAPLRLGDESAEEVVDDRISRIATAANRLGCSSIAIACEADDTDEVLEDVAEHIRTLMPIVERLELNFLLIPREGLTMLPDRLTKLVKTVGGFRIGVLPTFGHAAQTADPVETLRKLAPYAHAMQATVVGFGRGKKHKPFDLAAYIEAVKSVGYANALAIEYVGDSDPVKAITTARDIITSILDDS
jgi:sugar phosphate isomerase/epimerase